MTTNQSLRRAERALKKGDAPEARALFERVLSDFPGNARARRGWHSAGAAHVSALVAEARERQAVGALDAAERCWSRAADLAPQTPEIGLALTQVRLDLGRHHEALAAVDTVLQRTPAHPLALDLRGCALRELGRMAEAEESHRAALGQGRKDASPLNHLGILAQARGARDTAITFFRRALDLEPDQADLHHNLSRALSYTEAEPHLHQMLAMVATADRHEPAMAPLHFALFNALDQIGAHDAAFSLLVSGNALKHNDLCYDIKQEAMRMAFSKRLLADPVAPPLAHDPAPFRPILIVGLPRSGTTLAEQILSRAPGVRACGETSVVANALAPLLRKRAAGNADTLDPADLPELRQRLLAGYAPLAGGAAILTDKMPLNFRHLGFVSAALPEARIVHLVRDPMAVAWSIYKHLFAGQANRFAYSIGDICAFMLLHRDMMSFWRNRLGDRLHDLDYAALTRDPDTEIRALVESCRLPWSDACLAPQQSERTVLTASAAQVRQPIYRNSDEGWRRYEAQLAPLRHALKVTGLLE